jgi:hypothetical protein
MKKLIQVIALAALIFFISCSASTDTRYGKEEGTKDKETPVLTDESIKEDFDFTPFKTKFDIPEKIIEFPVVSSATEDLNIWYEYETSSLDTVYYVNRKIIDKINGYRVLILTTDNLEEANDMRSEIYFKTVQREVYIIFDPPFYKVMIGDFTELSEARDLNFKLNQMGYSEARVINETVNIFEQ